MVLGVTELRLLLTVALMLGIGRPDVKLRDAGLFAEIGPTTL